MPPLGVLVAEGEVRVVSETTLGMQWKSRTAVDKAPADDRVSKAQVNTRTALWSSRWPAIALQECIDIVEAAPAEEQAEVKFNLPCAQCVKNTACLNAKRKELGSLMYSREILTHPRTSDSSLFPRDLFAPMLMRREVFVPFWHKPFSVEHEYAVVQAWDIAWSEKVGGDWLVAMTAYVHKVTGRRHLLAIKRWQRITFDDQVKLIEAEAQTYKADLVVIEDAAAQTVWKQHMAKNTAVPVIGHGAGDKTSLAQGVPGLLILLENRKWEFPYGPKGSYLRENMDVFLNEAEAFGWVDGKLQGVGEHDDTVMCWWHLNWGIDKYVAMGTGETHRGVVPGARQ